MLDYIPTESIPLWGILAGTIVGLVLSALAGLITFPEDWGA